MQLKLISDFVEAEIEAVRPVDTTVRNSCEPSRHDGLSYLDMIGVRLVLNGAAYAWPSGCQMLGAWISACASDMDRMCGNATDELTRNGKVCAPGRGTNHEDHRESLIAPRIGIRAWFDDAASRLYRVDEAACDDVRGVHCTCRHGLRAA